MSAGVPMYYLTARSREHSRNRTTDTGGGMSASIARKPNLIRPGYANCRWLA